MPLTAGVYNIQGEAHDDNQNVYPCVGKLELFSDTSVTGVINDAEGGIFGGSSLVVEGTWGKKEISFEIRDAEDLETYKYEGVWSSKSLFSSKEGEINGEWQYDDWPSDRKSQPEQNRGSFHFSVQGPTPQNRKQYEVRVVTGNLQELACASETFRADFALYVQLIGSRGNSLPLQLKETNKTTKNAELFAMNQDDGFTVETETAVGKVLSVVVGHNATEEYKGYYLSRIELVDEGGAFHVFPFEKWLDAGRGQRATVATAPIKTAGGEGGEGSVSTYERQIEAELAAEEALRKSLELKVNELTESLEDLVHSTTKLEGELATERAARQQETSNYQEQEASLQAELESARVAAAAEKKSSEETIAELTSQRDSLECKWEAEKADRARVEAEMAAMQERLEAEIVSVKNCIAELTATLEMEKQVLKLFAYCLPSTATQPDPHDLFAAAEYMISDRLFLDRHPRCLNAARAGRQGASHFFVPVQHPERNREEERQELQRQAAEERGVLNAEIASWKSQKELVEEQAARDRAAYQEESARLQETIEALQETIRDREAKVEGLQSALASTADALKASERALEVDKAERSEEQARWTLLQEERKLE
ncbi:hypothetical protein CYMTET_30745, partial [Cymbomonas tetramitiformis]